MMVTQRRARRVRRGAMLRPAARAGHVRSIAFRRRTVRSYESLMSGSLIAFGNSGFM